MTTKFPETTDGKGVGPEKLSVRIFREIFAQSAHQTGKLKSNLDDYLKSVEGHAKSTPSDRKYARKIHADLSRLCGERQVSPPSTVKVDEQPKMTAEEIAAICDKSFSNEEARVLTGLDDPESVFFGSTPQTVEPSLATHEKIKAMFAEMKGKTTHPFVRIAEITDTSSQNGIYAGLGVADGRYTKPGPDLGKAFHVNCTINNYRRLREVPDNILVHHNGRPVTLVDDNKETGLRKTLYLVKFSDGIKIRFWSRIGDTDRPGGAKFVIFDSKAPGLWRMVPRAGFST